MAIGSRDAAFLEQGVDVCIVGAGVAGAMVATKLGRAGIRVLLLEAGPRHDPSQAMARMHRWIARDDPWRTHDPERDRFVSAGAVDYDLNRTRVKAVGGTTMHWAGYTPRFIAKDFRMRSTYGIGDDWPISYDELEPYYSEAEREMGVAGADDNPFASPRSASFPMPAFPVGYDDRFVADAGKALGIRFHSLPQARNSVAYGNRSPCVTFSACRACPIRARYSADIHVELAEATGNVHVISNATVVRLETRRRGRKVRRAIFATAPLQLYAVEAGIFVIAAHAVESARLLLLSADAGHEKGLANSSGLVGRYFMEHRSQHRHVQLDRPLYPGRKGFQTILSQQFHDLATRGEGSGFAISTETPINAYRGTVRRLRSQSGHWGEEFAREVEMQVARQMHQLTLRTQVEPLASLDNRVELDPAVRDSFGNPVPRLHYAISEYERVGYRKGREIIDALADQLGALSRENVRFHYSSHHAGTCRMGVDPGRSVVDRNLKAHDADNLFVVGSSNFVTLSLVNPTLTLTALALRLGDHLVASRAGF